MSKVAVVVPNYNGIDYIRPCLNSLKKQSMQDIEVVVVDNNSTDGSWEIVAADYPEVRLIRMRENTGFSGAVNEGISAADAPFVLLLNNDTEVEPELVDVLYRAIENDEKCFSVAAKMLSMHDHNIIDGAGDFYTVLGWAFARGKGAESSKYQKSGNVFSACAGAAIYRKSVFEQIGLFDEAHFAYLEDLDIGYRAGLYGYRNKFEPSAIVYHAGSAASGSRYNEFKVQLAAQNSILVMVKNLCLLQWILHFPMIILGIFIKWLFFTEKGLGKCYLLGLKKGIVLSNKSDNVKKRVKFRFNRLGNYCRIEWELWRNLFLLPFYR